MSGRDCPEVVCSGTPFERGRAHGSTLAPLIETGLARWRRTLDQFAGGDVDAYLARFLAETSFDDAISEHAPALAEEVDGLIAGSGIDANTLRAYQLLDEQWCYERRRTMADRGHRCSGIGIVGSPTIVSQNMDLPDHFDTTQCVLRLSGPDIPDTLVPTAAGLIALNGLNAAGVAVCVNSLLDRGDTDHGLPVAFVIRSVLMRTSAADAATFVRSVPHASGQNYLIGDASTVIDVEAGADGTDDYAPGDVVLHTNHSLAREVRQEQQAYADEHGMDISGLLNSHDRYGFLAGRIDASDDARDVQEALTDRTTPICRLASSSSRWMTFGSMVMELSDEPVLYIAPGPPNEEPFRTLGF